MLQTKKIWQKWWDIAPWSGYMAGVMGCHSHACIIRLSWQTGERNSLPDWGSKLPCCEIAYRSQVTRNCRPSLGSKSSLQLKASRKTRYLSPKAERQLCQQPEAVWKPIFPSWASDEPKAPAEPRTRLGCAQTPDLQKLWGYIIYMGFLSFSSISPMILSTKTTSLLH